METVAQRLKDSGHQVWTMSSEFVESTRMASARLRDTAGGASRSWAEQAKAASSAFAQESRTAGYQLIEGLRQEGGHWRQLASSGPTLLRLQAPASLREITRKGLMRRLQWERVALQRLSEGLRLLDARVQERLDGLGQLPASQAELLLPANYDRLSARKIASESACWTSAELRAALSHERETKERSTVLGHLERRLEGLQQAV